MSAGLATGDKLTAAIRAVWLGNEKTTTKRKVDTVAQQRAESSIAMPKTVAGMA
jgi:hypothetical protein